MSISDSLAAAGKSLLLNTNTIAVKTAAQREQEDFAAMLAEKTAATQQQRKAQEDMIATHNAAVMAMVDAVPDARQEFKDYMEMTPEERIRAQILQSLGLTEADVEAMSPEKRKALEEQIASILREKATQNLEESMQPQQDEPKLVG